MNWVNDCKDLLVEVDSEEYTPVRAHIGDAGLDCRSAVKETLTIYPGCAELINLGFKVQIPHGYAGFLVSRSGHSKLLVSLANAVGIIDHQYRGYVMARIENRGCDWFKVNHLDRIAQLIIVPIALPNVVVGKVSDSERGDKGFGSTGVQ